MEPDNLLPNDGTYFLPREPEEQVIDRKKDRARTLEALSALKEIVEHFNERIAFRSDLEAIKPDLAKDPAMHQKVCEVNDMLKLALMEEKQLLEEKLETHATNR